MYSLPPLHKPSHLDELEATIISCILLSISFRQPHSHGQTRHTSHTEAADAPIPHDREVVDLSMG